MDPFLIVAAVCALTTIVATLLVRFSGPVVASNLLRELLDRVEACEETIRRKKIELEGLAETMSIDKARAVAARNRASALERKQERREERDAPQVEPRTLTREDYEAAIAKRGQWGATS